MGQENCGSDWAFASIGAIESRLFVQNGELTPLSEQYLIDYVDNNGCDGGTIDNAF